MKLYTTTDASRPSSIFLTTSYTQPYTCWYVLTASSSLECSFIKKKGRHQMEVFCPAVKFSCVWSFEETALGKKRKDFHSKRHTFWRTRARERVHIYTEVDKMSGNTDVEKGNFAVKAGLAQVRDSHPRELARFSSVDGFSFLLRRRRHLFFSLLLRVTSFFFFCSSFFFFVRRLIRSNQQREFKRKKSVDDDR